MIYDLLAKFYDKVNGHIDYSVWADFIEKVAKENMAERPELVLDLGCGTGRMTIELARRGYDMIGVDSSAEMLDVARDAAESASLSDKVLLLLQDMCDFELYGTVEQKRHTAVSERSLPSASCSSRSFATSSFPRLKTFLSILSREQPHLYSTVSSSKTSYSISARAMSAISLLVSPWLKNLDILPSDAAFLSIRSTVLSSGNGRS